MATMPTTTPAAMPALFGPPFDESGVALADSDAPGAAVMTTVDVGCVAADGVVAVVWVAVLDDEVSVDDVDGSAEAVEALAETPVNQTLQNELPPPVLMSVLVQCTWNHIPHTHKLIITGAGGVAGRVVD